MSPELAGGIPYHSLSHQGSRMKNISLLKIVRKVAVFSIFLSLVFALILGWPKNLGFSTPRPQGRIVIPSLAVLRLVSGVLGLQIESEK